LWTTKGKWVKGEIEPNKTVTEFVIWGSTLVGNKGIEKTCRDKSIRKSTLGEKGKKRLRSGKTTVL